MNKKIPLAKPNVGAEELTAIKKVFESGILAQGPVTQEFKKEFKKYLGVKHAIATTSCTTALDLALFSSDLHRGSEVIIPDFTFPATGNVVFHAGAKPVLVDIDMETYNIDPNAIESAITEKTKAIMPVHLFGQSAEMRTIMEIAEKYDLTVIEDAACGVGATYNGKKVGTLGHAACFSFHPRKILTTGEGGMLVTNIDEIAEKARAIADHGKKMVGGKTFFVFPGYNFRLNDVLSAIGLVQLKKVDSIIQRRIELAKKYDNMLQDFEKVKVPSVAPKVRHTYQTYCILIKKEDERDRLIEKLAEKGIETQIGTYALHLQPQYSKFRNMTRGDLTFSTKAFKNTLALPLYDSLKREEQEYVCENLKMYL